jgi:hypothetical protein
MDRNVGVDCIFNEDGSIRVNRIMIDARWMAVEQGRQWVDQIGRHILIRLVDGTVQEICLRSDTMIWWITSIEDRHSWLV